MPPLNFFKQKKSEFDRYTVIKKVSPAMLPKKKNVHHSKSRKINSPHFNPKYPINNIVIYIKK